MAKEFLNLENEMNIEFKIKPKSPLLIQLGESKDKKKSENTICWTCDKTYARKNIEVQYEEGKKIKDDREGKIYIPGSTIKGMFRNYFYKIYCALGDKPLDEFGDILLEKDIPQEDIYEASENISKLFGSKVLRTRLVAQDAVVKNKKFSFDDLLTRSITPIDRFTGEAMVPLSFEYTNEEFLFNLRVRNIKKDELQKIYFLIRDSINGEIRIGSSKSRGFGLIELEISDFNFEVYKGKSEDLEFIEEFSEIDNNKSKKIGNSYLSKSLKLRDEYKDIDILEPNEFIQQLFKG